MNILEIINKKKLKQELSEQEIDFFVKEYTITKTIPDYQASALLMAIRLNGLNTYETFYLTKAFVKYSEHYDFKKGYEDFSLIDKHSSGGVGDKVTIILGPLLACFNIRTVKISGRGLGHTGGTIDKLDAINVTTNINHQKYLTLANKTKCIIMSQTDQLVPSDKMIYALRDVTSTVDSFGLIAASILAKKFVINSDYIFIDLKVGSGALVTNIKDAIKLAKLMSDVAKLMKRKIEINITNMSQPLGKAIGNLIEINEAFDFLQGKNQAPDLKALIYEFTTEILLQTNTYETRLAAINAIDHVINNNQARDSFLNWIKAQNGNYNEAMFKPKYKYEIKAKKDGYVQFLDAKEVGLIALELGAGRHYKEEKIDFQAGIYLNQQTNDKVHKNEVVATLYSSKPIEEDVIKRFEKNYNINQRKIKLSKPIIKTI